MLGNVLLKALRDQRRALLGVGIGIALMVLLMGALWPSIQTMSTLDELLAGYPDALRELFNLEDFGTGRGFLNAELFSAMLPVLFIAFSVARGARAVAGEEEAGTLEVLLVTRVSTSSLLVQQAAALAMAVATMGVVLYGSLLAVSPLFGLHVATGDLASACLALVLLGVEFGWIALAVGAATGRRPLAVAVGTALAAGSYLLYAAGELVDSVRPWQQLSPFHQTLDGGPLGAGLPLAYLWPPLTGAVAVAIALVVFGRRDITRQ